MAVEKSIKKNKELRRELEILRAQLKVTTPEMKRGAVPVAPRINKSLAHAETSLDTLEVNDSYVKRDMLKTLLLSALAFSTIFAIWLQTRA